MTTLFAGSLVPDRIFLSFGANWNPPIRMGTINSSLSSSFCPKLSCFSKNALPLAVRAYRFSPVSSLGFSVV